MKSLGDTLKAAREERGISIDQAIHETNISRNYLEALESEDFAEFPAEAYLVGFLRNPKFKLRPVIRLLQDHIEPLREHLQWGPLVPYNLTGQMNRHPSAAIEFLDSGERKNYLKFFDQLVTDA